MKRYEYLMRYVFFLSFPQDVLFKQKIPPWKTKFNRHKVEIAVLLNQVGFNIRCGYDVVGLLIQDLLKVPNRRADVRKDSMLKEHTLTLVLLQNGFHVEFRGSFEVTWLLRP